MKSDTPRAIGFEEDDVVDVVVRGNGSFFAFDHVCKVALQNINVEGLEPLMPSFLVEDRLLRTPTHLGISRQQPR